MKKIYTPTMKIIFDYLRMTEDDAIGVDIKSTTSISIIDLCKLVLEAQCQALTDVEIGLGEGKQNCSSRHQSLEINAHDLAIDFVECARQQFSDELKRISE